MTEPGSSRLFYDARTDRQMTLLLLCAMCSGARVEANGADRDHRRSPGEDGVDVLGVVAGVRPP